MFADFIRKDVRSGCPRRRRRSGSGGRRRRSSLFSTGNRHKPSNESKWEENHPSLCVTPVERCWLGGKCQWSHRASTCRRSRRRRCSTSTCLTPITSQHRLVKNQYASFMSQASTFLFKRSHRRRRRHRSRRRRRSRAPSSRQFSPSSVLPRQMTSAILPEPHCLQIYWQRYQNGKYART